MSRRRMERGYWNGRQALWKQFNGYPRWDETETYGPSVIHNGTKRKQTRSKR